MRGIKPEQAGKFVVEETRRNAYLGIVTRDVIETGQRTEPVEQPLRLPATRRFAGDEEPRARLQSGPEQAKFAGRKLVEDEIAADNVIGVVAGETAQVEAMPVRGSRPGIGGRAKVKCVDAPAVPLESQGDIARARPEFEGVVGRSDVRPPDPGQPAVVAHQEIDELQIAPAVERGGMVAGQGVKQFRLNEAGWHTARCGGSAQTSNGGAGATALPPG